MISSSPSGNSPPQPISPATSSLGQAEMTTGDERTLSQLEHSAALGGTPVRTGNIPTVVQAIAAVHLVPPTTLSPHGCHIAASASTGSVKNQFLDSQSTPSTTNPLKLSIRRRILRFFKNGSKTGDTIASVPASLVPASPAPSVHATVLEADVTAVPLDARSLTPRIQGITVMPTAPVIQIQQAVVAQSPLRLDIFPKNVVSPTLTADLPKPEARIEMTTQLVYCCSLLARAQTSLPSPGSGTSLLDACDVQALPLDKKQRHWVQQVQSSKHDEFKFRWLIDQLVKGFADDKLKAPATVSEIVLVGPVLDRVTYRSMLSCFIAKFKTTTPLDVVLLQGLVQLIECASAGYLVDDDLVKIAKVLSKELMVTHTGTSDHPLYLTWALSRVLDVMVASEVKDLDRDRDHQPILQLLRGLKESDNVYLRYQAAYAYQALQYAPDDETPLQVVWRYTQGVALAVSAATSVFKLDPLQLIEGLERLQQIGGSAFEVIKSGIESLKSFVDVGQGAATASKRIYNSQEKQAWYLTLQLAAGYVQRGQLQDFNNLVCNAPCRRSANFQWGVCRLLGEIAADPLWDVCTRQQAVEFLGELYASEIDWKPHADVKYWILTILVQISQLLDFQIKDHALTMLDDLSKDGTTAFSGSHPLSTRLSLPETFLLLAKVQDIPKVEHELQTLRKQRMSEYKQMKAVYIAPMAKPNLQALDNNVFPLMKNVKRFLEGDSQVMLILGDSGSGKSTFNRYLEYRLWRKYESGGRIPLFINLPVLEKPEKELVAEQLRTFDFSDEQIRELKAHRQFTLICDGYDERQLRSNLHTTNLLNQPGQWKTKLTITCRSQYLGRDYRDCFVPKASSKYYCSANDLFQEAVIAPFSKDQIEDYVKRYVPLEPRTWAKKDYMDKLTKIPNLMDLVKNPFLLTLCLESLPSVVEGKTDLSRLQITRVQLYDNFVDHWMTCNKRRLHELKLDGNDLKVRQELLDDGFEKNGIKFQQNLAAAIFREQEGQSVVRYAPKDDECSWKADFFSLKPEVTLLRDVSLLSRSGNKFRFIHRSVLEYFYSCTICPPSDNNGGYASQNHVDFSTVFLSNAEHPLTHRNLVAEPSILQFLAERVDSYPHFKRHLHSILEQSKTDDKAGMAAANAITILVRAGIRFNGEDLQSIRIPGADVSNGQFDTAQLQGADLNGVNFTKSWIRQADFTGAQMQGVQFGELPYLNMPEQVCSCAFSPDGKAFAVGLDRGDITLYNTATWTKICPFQGHRRSVCSLAFSPCSRQLLSASEDCTIRLWDKQTGQSLLVLEGHSGEVTAAAFSPLGKQIASGSRDKTIRLWNVQCSPATFISIKVDSDVSSVIYSPDGLHVASSSGDMTIRVFDTHTCLPVLTLSEWSAPTPRSSLWDIWCSVSGIVCIAYSPNGERIVSGDRGGELQLWNVMDGQPESKWKGHAEDITNLVFSPNGHWIASTSCDNTIKLWNAHTGAPVSTFSGHTSSVSSLAFSPDSPLLASSSLDKTVRIWQMSSTEGVAHYSSGAINPVSNIVYSSNGRFLLTVTKDRHACQYDAATGAPGLPFFVGYVHCIAYSVVESRFATASGYDVTIWNAETGLVDFVLTGHTEEVKTIAFSRCGRWIATGSEDATIRLWDVRSRTHVRTLSGHTDWISSLAMSANKGCIISGSIDGSIRAWNVNTGVSRVCISEEHEVLASIPYTDETLEDSDEARIAFIMDMKYSPSTRQIASTHGHKKVLLWDEETDEFQHTLEHDFNIICFEYSSCGQWITTSSSDDSVWLWNCVAEEGVQKWKCVSKITCFFSRVQDIAWRPGTLEFATACQDSSLRVWRVQTRSSNVSVQLVWSAGPTALVAIGAAIADTVDLSQDNKRLLLQQGAIDGLPLAGT